MSAPEPNSVSEPKRSKVLLLAIHATGLSMLGVDRMYMGCWTTGILKMCLGLCLISAIIRENIDPRTPLYQKIPEPLEVVVVIGALLGLIWFLWDMVFTWINALAGVEGVAFTYCDDTEWQNEGDVAVAQGLAFLQLATTLTLLSNGMRTARMDRDIEQVLNDFSEAEIPLSPDTKAQLMNETSSAAKLRLAKREFLTAVTRGIKKRADKIKAAGRRTYPNPYQTGQSQGATGL